MGHFRTERRLGGTTVSAAGRIPAGDLHRAFCAARTIERAIREAPVDAGCDRHEALGLVWKAIVAIDGEALGPMRGSDLAIVFATSDPNGTGISGMGLGAVWGGVAGQFEPLVEGSHPLLSGPGRPDGLAGVLTLDQSADTIVGVPHDHPETPIAGTDWHHRCGVHS